MSQSESSQQIIVKDISWWIALISRSADQKPFYLSYAEALKTNYVSPVAHKRSIAPYIAELFPNLEDVVSKLHGKTSWLLTF